MRCPRSNQTTGCRCSRTSQASDTEAKKTEHRAHGELSRAYDCDEHARNHAVECLMSIDLDVVGSSIETDA